MGKEQLREKLKQLDHYLRTLDFQSTLLEEDTAIPMDTLAVL